MEISPTVLEVETFPTISMHCEICNSNQTFKLEHLSVSSVQVPYLNFPSKGEIFTLNYLCAGCSAFMRVFLVKVSDNCDYAIKVGQYPGIDISIEKDVEKSLGKYVDIFKKGRICEAQGYGIGAYSYYRRIVESLIDELLDGIPELLDNEKKDEYLKALEKTKNLQHTSEKIEIVKDLLPPILTADGLNPLGALYGILSEGIHNNSDDECIYVAGEIRTILIFLLKEVISLKHSRKEYSESMKIIKKNLEKSKQRN